MKIHASYDIKNQIPDFMVVTEAKQSDDLGMKSIPVSERAIYVLDRGYLCLKTLANINENRAFFGTRTKINTQYTVVEKNKVTGDGIIEGYWREYFLFSNIMELLENKVRHLKKKMKLPDVHFDLGF